MLPFIVFSEMNPSSCDSLMAAIGAVWPFALVCLIPRVQVLFAKESRDPTEPIMVGAFK
jgi:hypothetical protein